MGFMIFCLPDAKARMQSINDRQLESVNGETGTLAVMGSEKVYDTKTPEMKSNMLILKRSNHTDVKSDPGADESCSTIEGHTDQKKFIPVGEISKDIHTHANGADLLFNMNVTVQNVIMHQNNTRVVETWGGNRTDFNALYPKP